MNRLCTAKEVARVPRALGLMRRVDAKMKQPRRKDVMETRDLSQPKGFDRGWSDAPSARKIVFPSEVSISYSMLKMSIPVCIDTKQDQALYALLSQRPDTKQHAMMGISACSIAISPLKY